LKGYSSYNEYDICLVEEEGDKELRISVKESAWKVFSTQTDIETFAHSIAMASNLVLKT